jgi:biotin-(acetyl-CoA carboxylase) ligase/methylase of polypeptide subunit release factors
MVMNKCFVQNNNVVSGPIFSEESVSREIELIEKSTRQYEWLSPTGELFRVELPHTVYPPREDTDFMAESLFRLGPGKGRKCLEIGTGSGVLSLFCHRQGWRVSACDINPYAVASAKEFFTNNSAGEISLSEGGPGPDEDGSMEQWAGQGNYDLVFWNMPYIKTSVNESNHLGPMEDAALIDTSRTSLIDITLGKLRSSNLLSQHGLGLLSIGENYTEEEINDLCSKYGFASRIVNQLNFDDGECLRIMAFWHPYARYPTIQRENVTSTNGELLNEKWPIGSSLSADHQTKGRGRYNREWTNTPKLLACSWKIGKQPDISPEILQILCGYLVKRSFESISHSNQNCKTVLKWPNDLVLIEDGRWGKVCGILVESVSKGNDNQIVVGIGINISDDGKSVDTEFPIGFADWYSEGITKEFLLTQINSRMAGLFESIDGIPQSNFESVIGYAFDAIANGFYACKTILYRNKQVSFKAINDNASISLISNNGEELNCNESEDLIWLFI